MLLLSHVTVSCAIAYRFLGAKDLLSLVAVGVGSILPDWIETVGKIRILKHRGISHAAWFWTLVFLSWWVSVQKGIVPLSYAEVQQIAFYARFLIIGIFMHLAEDALTMTGIPIAPFRPERLALRLFATGSRGEAVFVLLVVLVCWLV